MVNGTVRRIEVTNVLKITDPADFGLVTYDLLIFVADDLNMPYPGLPIQFGGANNDDAVSALTHTEAEQYHYATTGTYS